MVILRLQNGDVIPAVTIDRYLENNTGNLVVR